MTYANAKIIGPDADCQPAPESALPLETVEKQNSHIR